MAEIIFELVCDWRSAIVQVMNEGGFFDKLSIRVDGIYHDLMVVEGGFGRYRGRSVRVSFPHRQDKEQCGISLFGSHSMPRETLLDELP